MKKNKKTKNGVSLKLIQSVIVIMAVIITAATFFAVFRTIRGYKTMDEATDIFLKCEKSASDLNDASDYLTDQVRFYAVNGNIVNLENYFTELEVTKRRDKAAEFIKDNFSGSKEYDYLKTALDESNKLVLIEYYSMRLRAESTGVDVSLLPKAIRETVLKEEDAALDSEGKKQLAVSIVYDAVYESYKDRISKYTGMCLDTLIRDSLENMQREQKDLLTMLIFQESFIVALLLIVILFFALTLFMVIRPIKIGVEKIKSGRRMEVKGAKEMRAFSEIYNKIYEENTKANEILSFEANHDVMTGLYNRTAFDKILSIGGWEKVAFMIIDVDNFKQINDTYGHQTGDIVLGAVGEALSSTFRSGDFVCRLGGDEFAVIMVDVGRRLKELVVSKYSEMQKKLAANDGIPKGTTLSAGVAFGNWEEDSKTIFENADKALYESKEKGRNTVSFYDD